VEKKKIIMKILVLTIVLLYAFSTYAQVINPPDVGCPFTYTGTTGPINWATMCINRYPGCSSTSQSPIDIIPHWAINMTLGPVNKEYMDTTNALMSWDGASLKIYPNTGSTFGSLASLPKLPYLSGNASSYVFKYAMLHATSEHTIYGIAYDLELQLFHEEPVNNTVVVLSYLYSIGFSSTLLSGIVSALSVTGAKTASADSPLISTISIPWNSGLNQVGPLNGSYWAYNGSQTSPPCTASYNYFVFADTQSVSQSQFNTLSAVLSNNWRPLQRQNTRAVWYYSGVASQPVASSGSSLSPMWWKLF